MSCKEHGRNATMGATLLRGLGLAIAAIVLPCGILLASSTEPVCVGSFENMYFAISDTGEVCCWSSSASKTGIETTLVAKFKQSGACCASVLAPHHSELICLGTKDGKIQLRYFNKGELASRLLRVGKGRVLSIHVVLTGYIDYAILTLTEGGTLSIVQYVKSAGKSYKLELVTVLDLAKHSPLLAYVRPTVGLMGDDLPIINSEGTLLIVRLEERGFSLEKTGEVDTGLKSPVGLFHTDFVNGPGLAHIISGDGSISTWNIDEQKMVAELQTDLSSISLWTTLPEAARSQTRSHLLLYDRKQGKMQVFQTFPTFKSVGVIDQLELDISAIDGVSVEYNAGNQPQLLMGDGVCFIGAGTKSKCHLFAVKGYGGAADVAKHEMPTK